MSRCKANSPVFTVRKTARCFSASVADFFTTEIVDLSEEVPASDVEAFQPDWITPERACEALFTAFIESIRTCSGVLSSECSVASTAFCFPFSLKLAGALVVELEAFFPEALTRSKVSFFESSSANWLGSTFGAFTFDGGLLVRAGPAVRRVIVAIKEPWGCLEGRVILTEGSQFRHADRRMYTWRTRYLSVLATRFQAQWESPSLSQIERISKTARSFRRSFDVFRKTKSYERPKRRVLSKARYPNLSKDDPVFWKSFIYLSSRNFTL